MSDACVLDTHAWIAFMGDAPGIPRRAARRLQRADTAYVPAICLRETALLAERGTLGIAPGRDGIDAWMRAALRDPCVLAPLTPEIAAVSARLVREGFHRDPGDQMIYATARAMDLPLITGDQAIHAFEATLPRVTKRLAVWD